MFCHSNDCGAQSTMKCGQTEWRMTGSGSHIKAVFLNQWVTTPWGHQMALSLGHLRPSENTQIFTLGFITEATLVMKPWWNNFHSWGSPQYVLNGLSVRKVKNHCLTDGTSLLTLNIYKHKIISQQPAWTCHDHGQSMRSKTYLVLVDSLHTQEVILD